MSSKKEDKQAYKLMKFRAGIFQIRNLQNGKCLLQTTQDLDKAFNSDLFQLKAGLHQNKELQKDWNTMASEAFALEIVDELKLKDDATPTQIHRDLKDFLEMCKVELIDKGGYVY
jgi:hypothetical protein